MQVWCYLRIKTDSSCMDTYYLSDDNKLNTKKKSSSRVPTMRKVQSNWTFFQSYAPTWTMMAKKRRLCQQLWKYILQLQIFALLITLLLEGSIFSYKLIQKATQISSDHVTENQISLVCIHQKWRRKISLSIHNRLQLIIF